MSNTETIPDVPLDWITPLPKHPEMDVKLFRDPTMGDSFTGTASLLHEFSWIHTSVEPLKPIAPLHRDWSRGAQGYTARLPESEVYIPAHPSFARDGKLGWTCELGTDAVKGQVFESICGIDIGRAKPSHTQDFKVRRRLILDPGIATCLREERSEQSLPASANRSIATRQNTGSRLSDPRGSACTFTPEHRRLDQPIPTPVSATFKSDVPSPWRQGQLLNVNYRHPSLLPRNVGRLKDFYYLNPNGDHYSIKVCSTRAPNPSENPVTMEGELRVPVETVRQAINSWNPEATLNEEEPLYIQRRSVTFTNPLLPGENFTAADLPYDAELQKFAFTVDEFCSWRGRLPKYKVPIDGTLLMRYTVNPEEFPCLKERALSGRPVVLSPEDHVRSLTDPLGVTFTDPARRLMGIEDQLAIDRELAGFIRSSARGRTVDNSVMEAVVNDVVKVCVS